MKIIDLPPYAPILIESTRAIGYSLETAVADIIDNSIAADANKIEISYFPVGESYISILDNGKGMNTQEINVAMQYGSKNPQEMRNAKDLGRFGLGLKTASLSQCRVLTVVSKQESTVVARQWNIDYVIKTGQWSLISLDDQEIKAIPQISKLLSLKSGTLVVWQNLDRLKMGEINFEQSMGRKLDDVRDHLSLVYHRYLKGESGIKRIQITMNGLAINPQDPFLIEKSNQTMEDEIIIIRGKKVIVRPFILPHTSKLTAEEIKSLGGKEGLRRGQGFYIYRNKRLLIWGTWFRMIRKGETSKLARIQVDIPNDLDDLWTLDIKKSEAIPPAEVKNNLKSIVDRISDQSTRTWVFRGKKETNDEIVHVWNRIKTRNGGYLYSINRDNPVIKQLESKDDNTKRAVELLLKQIETSIPLNSLYVDLTRDEKIENEKTVDFEDILNTLKLLLNSVEESSRKGFLDSLKRNEPFNNYIPQIDDAVERGII